MRRVWEGEILWACTCRRARVHAHKPMDKSFSSTLSHQASPEGISGRCNATYNPDARVCVARDSVHPSPSPPVTIPIPLPLIQLTPPDQGQSLGLLPCTQSSISSPYPNLTQHLTQCKTSLHAHDPAHHHPILTRPSPNLSQILKLPSHLQHSPLTPQSNSCHHLLPPSPPKTTTTTIRDRTPMATHRHSHLCQRHTKLGIQLLPPWHRPSLGPAQGPTPKRGPSLDQKRAPQKMSPHSWGT